MKCWELISAGKLKLSERAAQSPKSGFVKIKTIYGAISRSDVDFFSGIKVPEKLPLVLGRHSVGMVTEVGGGGEIALERGDRVVVDSFLHCEDCAPCKDDMQENCANPKLYGIHEQGLLSDFAIVRHEDLFKLPDHITNEDAAFTGHLALAINIATKLQLKKGESLVIMGATVLGILLAQVALYYHAVPIIIDNRADRLELAKQCGVFYLVNTVKEDTKKELLIKTHGTGAETLCYISNSAIPLAKSLDFVMPNGRVAIAGWSSGAMEPGLPLPSIYEKQLSIVGVSSGAKLLPAAINLLANKAVSVAPALRHIVNFDEVEKTIKQMVASPGLYIKVLVRGM